jgi:hypothetical protein
MRFRARLAILIPALALTAFASVPAARAQDSMVESFMGILGLKSQDSRDDIEYRERAPLVVPPKMTLRTPEEPGAKRSAAWPNDPDVQRRKQREANAKVPRTETEMYRANKDNNALSIQEIRAGRREGANMVTAATPYKSQCESCREGHWLNPDQLRALDRKIEPEKTLVAGQEPERRYLTDPPTGYRMPSANAPLVAPRGAIRTKQSEKDEASPYQMYRRNNTQE